MMRPKPTTIIALDPHAVAFCEEVRGRLRYDFGNRGRLTHTFAVVCAGDSLRFEDNLSSVADATFDLQAARINSRRMKPQAASDLFKLAARDLEPDIIRRLLATRKSPEIEPANSEDIQGAGSHIVYIVLSASDPFSNGVVIELARLMRWLFLTRFATEAFSLEAVVLLPEMFLNAEGPDYAAAYSLLKKLDYNTDKEIEITRTHKSAPFEYCWLLNSRNNLGSLADNLYSYSDAFAGFLTAEPERSGALLTHKVRGKTPAYSTFGHAELFFPADITIRRLSAALARDIVTRAFLADQAPINVERRKLLLGAKQFVLSEDYVSARDGLERDKGAEIWQNFAPGVEIREGRHRENVDEIQRRAKKFKEANLNDYKKALLLRSEQLQNELAALLDKEIDSRTDQTPSGLHEALEFDDVLTDPALALEADTLSDRPQNIFTEQRAAKARLDSRLEFSPSYEKSQSLLDEIETLRGRLESRLITLRLLPMRPEKRGGEKSAEPEPTGAKPEQVEPEPQDERQRTAFEIEEINQKIAALSGEYKQAVDAEDEANDRARREAMKNAVEAKEQAIAERANAVIETGDKLGQARLTLEQLQEERRQFARRYFVLYPAIALIIAFVIPGVFAIFNIAPGTALWKFYLNNLSDVIAWTMVILAIYYTAAGIKFATGINRKIASANAEVERLKRALQHDGVQLVRAHNDKLRLDYETYEYRLRIEMFVSLFEEARRKATELREKIASLKEARAAFVKQHREAVPVSSKLRRSVLHVTDIDGYYQKEIVDPGVIAEIFAREVVKRSQVRRITIEEFRTKLSEFTRKQFKHLEELSIEDVLLRGPNLISPDTAFSRLSELNAASQPLLQLNDTDSNLDKLSQRDVTLWANAEEREQLLVIYRKICQEVLVLSHEDKRALRVLTRFLYFPAYFIGQIEYFRNCYDRQTEKEAESLPDLIPLSKEVRLALEQLLLGIALGLVKQNDNENYLFSNGKFVLTGSNRRQVAEKLATEFASVSVYAELSAVVKENLSDQNLVYQKLMDFKDSAPDLDSAENEVLDALLQKYHPWR